MLSCWRLSWAEEWYLRRKSDDVIAWVMVYELNCAHDQAGVSCGRSLVSYLLQIALDYNSFYKICAGWPLKDLSPYLVAEAKRRKGRQQLTLFDNLSLEQMSDRQLVELAIDHMKKWYEEDHKRVDCINQGEYELAMAIAMLLPLSFSPQEHRVEELKAVWQDRYYTMTRSNEEEKYQHTLDRT